MCSLGGMFLEAFDLEKEAHGAPFMTTRSARYTGWRDLSKAPYFHHPDKHLS